jgi:hypothetical protein
MVPVLVPTGAENGAVRLASAFISWHQAEGMGFEPTTPCGAPDFESYLSVCRLRPRSSKAATCLSLGRAPDSAPVRSVRQCPAYWLQIGYTGRVRTLEQIAPRGVEPLAQPPGKTPNSQPRGAQNGALAAPGQLDAETIAQGQAQIDVALVVVIQAWPHLPEAIRGRGSWRWCERRTDADRRGPILSDRICVGPVRCQE